MNLAIYDPKPYANEYASRMFIESVRRFAVANSIPVHTVAQLEQAKGETVVLCTDHLSEERIQMLKNNGNRIVGFNVTDSSYISQPIRYAPSLNLIDHIFMLSGIQMVNVVEDMAVDDDLNITSFDVPFLDIEAWTIYQKMFQKGQLHPLPYVSWEPIPDVERKPWAQRSQKAIIRGGGHSRRFLLALFLMLKDKLDPNSGFVLHPYFADDMNPQFRFCDSCRSDYKQHHRARYNPAHSPTLGGFEQCNSPAKIGDKFSFSNLGHWNNRCPRSFFWFAEQFQKRYGPVDMAIVEKMLNARWLHPREHMEMLGRILFTSDFKWIHSIYQPQRFWEGASAGCISVLPKRTQTQATWPILMPGQNYLTFNEDFSDLEQSFSISESDYNAMAGENRALFEQWMSPTTYPISTNLLDSIFRVMSQ